MNIPDIYNQVSQDCAYLVSLRREFHKYPELSKKEFDTAKRIEQELDKIGVSHTRFADTGIYAEIVGKNSGKTILLRSDMDALPIQEEHVCDYMSQNVGVMHACGHDAHMTALLGAARYLSHHKDEFSGKVCLVFQPGEEIGYGGKKFLESGLYPDANRALGFHSCPKIPCGNLVIKKGPIWSSVDYFRVDAYGKSCHIASPELGIDATSLMAELYIVLKQLNENNGNPEDRVLVGIGALHSGTQYNVVSDHAYLEGTIRTFSKEKREQIKAKIESLSQKLAKSYAAQVQVTIRDNTSPCINDAEVCDELKELCTGFLPKESLIEEYSPEMVGDDFALYLEKTKGAFVLIGTMDNEREETKVPLHNSHFDIDENAILLASTIYVAYSLKTLS